MSFFPNMQSNNINPTGELVQGSIGLGRYAEVIVIKQVAIKDKDAFERKYQEFLTDDSSENGKNSYRKSVRLDKFIDVSDTKLPFDVVNNRKALSNYLYSGIKLNSDYELLFDSGTSTSLNTLAKHFVNIRTKYLQYLACPMLDMTKLAYIVTHKFTPSGTDSTFGQVFNFNLKDDNLGLSDIINIKVDLNVYSVATATITLKNALRAYELTNVPYNKEQLYQSIFEPNDIVIIRLPKMYENPDQVVDRSKNVFANTGLDYVFTGFINNVNKNSSVNNNVMSIKCEGPTKLLRMQRFQTANTPATTDVIASLTPFTAFQYPALKDSHQNANIIKKIVFKAITDVNKTPFVQDLMAQYKTFFAEKKYSRLVSLSKTYNTAIETNEKNYIKSIESSENDFHMFYNKKTLYPTENCLKFPILSVHCTNQTFFQKVFDTNFNLWWSTFKTCLGFMREISDAVQFVFYESEIGTMKFEKLNVSLNKLRSGYERNPYVLNTFVCYNTQVIESTSEIQNIITVIGDFLYQGVAEGYSFGNGYVIRNEQLIQKYGELQGNQVNVVGLKNPEACRIYGVTLLERMNRKAISSANVTVIGSSEIKVGNYCYLESENALFYIEQVNHSFNVGGKYETNLTLSYRRNPVLRIDDYALFIGYNNEKDSDILYEINKKALNEVDYSKYATWEENPIMGEAMCSAMLFRIKTKMISMGYTKEEIDNTYNVSNLQDFYFNGYIWEPAIEADFSKLTTNYINSDEYTKTINENSQKLEKPKKK